MAHLGMGTMFGMTLLGDPQAFLHSQRRPIPSSIKDIPKESFLKIFLEKGRFHRNDKEIRRAILPQIFTDAMGRQLNGSEIDLMLRYFPLIPGNITFDEFEKGLDDMKADKFVPPPPVLTKAVRSLRAPSKQKTLNSQIAEMKHKHKRDVLGPTDVALRPLTTNMEYGWDTMLYPGDSFIRNDERKPYFPKGGTDVTQARGIQIKNEKFIGVRGGYHGKLSIARPVTSNQAHGFVGIHRRPSTSLSSSNSSRYLDHFQSNYMKGINRHDRTPIRRNV